LQVVEVDLEELASLVGLTALAKPPIGKTQGKVDCRDTQPRNLAKSVTVE